MTGKRIDYWDGSDAPHLLAMTGETYDAYRDAMEVIREQLDILADEKRRFMPPEVRVKRARRIIEALNRLTVISRT